MKETILIVDDTPENIDVLKGILEGEYSIKIATNGSTALKIAGSSEPPDLILLDIMMPEMDGYQVCKQLREDRKTGQIPVIFVTAKDHIEDEAKGLELGAVDYITKPVQPLLVKARVKTHLKIHEQNIMLQKEKELNDYELLIAEKIQKHFIPETAPYNDIFSIQVLHKQTRPVGGDFIDYFISDSGDVGIILADVSGHGIPASLITAMLKVFTLDLAFRKININNFLNNLNDKLCRIISNQFVAVLLGILERKDNSFVFNNAGQCYPLFYHREKNRIFRIKTEGSALGMYGEITLNNPVRIKLNEGDKLFLYTDGITEGINRDIREGEKILLREIMKYNSAPLRIIIENIYVSLEKEMSRKDSDFNDDFSLVGISLRDE